MAEQTTNLHLKKPAYGDSADVKDFNDNMDTLDSVIKQAQTDIQNRIIKPSGVAEGKFLQTDANGDAVWGDAADQETIISTTEGWLTDHISTNEFGVDDTLLIAGDAADSKTVGDKITELSRSINHNSNEITEETENLFGFSVDSYTHNGLTITNYHDGTFNINGTNSGSNYITNIDTKHTPNDVNISWFVFEPGTYTVKKGYLDQNGNYVEGSGTNIRFMEYSSIGGSSRANRGNDSYTFTTDTTFYGRFKINETDYSNQKACIYVSKGSEAKETRHLSAIDDVAREATNDAMNNIESLSTDVAFTNKQISEETENLFGLSVDNYIHNGLTITNNYDGTFNVNGTNSGTNYVRYIDINHTPTPVNYSWFVFAPGTYTVKKGYIDENGIFVTGSGTYIRFFEYDTYIDGSLLANIGNDSYTFTTDTTIYGRFRLDEIEYENQRICIYISKGGRAKEIQHLTAVDAVAREAIKEVSINNEYMTPFQEQEDAIVKKVLSNRRADTLTVAIIADTHHRSTSPDTMYDTKKQSRAIAKIAEKADAAFVVHLGDVIQGYQETHDLNEASMIDLWSEQRRTYIPVLYTIAHHEMFGNGREASYMDDPTALTIGECIGISGFGNKQLNITYSEDRTDWYFDINGIRVIGLNSVSVSSRLGFRSSDIAFLEQALANISIPVLIFAHVPPIMKSKTITNGSQVISILNNFVDNGGTILAYIHGHIHLDAYVPLNNNIGIKFKMISICCALVRHYDDIEDSQYGNPTSPDRQIGAYSEYCFDILNAHKTGVLNFYRFGAGNDRTC